MRKALGANQFRVRGRAVYPSSLALVGMTKTLPPLARQRIFRRMARTSPDLTEVITRPLDVAARNVRAATAVAPYTLRARPGAPVAMPIEWSEVEDRRLSPQRYKLKDALRTVERGEDPWKGWRRRARSLTEPSRRLARLQP